MQSEVEREEPNKEVESVESSSDNEEWEDVKEQFWNPENEGDYLIGIFKGVKHEVGKHKSDVYDFETPNGIMSVFSSTVLDDAMRYIEPGQKIRIEYLGKPKGKTYKNFKVQKSKQKPNTEDKTD